MAIHDRWGEDNLFNEVVARGLGGTTCWVAPSADLLGGTICRMALTADCEASCG